jgi:hypothetical protein
VIRSLLPTNLFRAINRPIGIPARDEMRVEKKLTFRDRVTIIRRSSSRDHKR